MLGLTAGQNSSVMWGNDKAKTLDAGEMMLQHHIQHQFCEFDRWPQAPHSPYKACARSNRKDVAETVAVLNIPNQEINVTNVKLGEGSTSEVFAAVWNGKHLALKIQRSRRFSAILEQEIQTAHAIGNHPCLVNMVGVCRDLDTKIICYDLQYGGTLDDVLDLTTEDAVAPAERMVESLAWMEDVLSALNHLHTLDIPVAHRDLKPGNLFFSADRKRLRLGDFGLCKSLSSMAGGDREPVGSFRYMAPEALQGEGGCSEKVDIWAAGLVMWACAVRSRPFDALGEQEAAQLLANHGLLLPIECVANDALQGLIRSALEREPTARPSAQEMLGELARLRRSASSSKRKWSGVLADKLMSGLKAIRSVA